jgi:hypothetical protein
VRRLERAICLLATLVWGCRETVVDHVPLDMRLPDAPECRAALGTLTLSGLGDFPTHDVDVAQFDASGAPIDSVTHFRAGTLAFSASAHATSAGWDAFGWASRDSLAAAASPTLVLRPLGVSCPLADPEARLPVGASLVVLDEARVMFVGGIDETGDATRRVAVLHVRDESVELPRVDRVVPIAFAAATLVPEGDAVLVTGGASSAGGEGRDTWERIPLDGGMATFGALDERRRDHAALAVDVDGLHGVLLVGGTDGSSVVRSIEWVDPTTDTGGVLDARLASGRVSPLLVRLDESHLAVVGGVDDAGAAVTSIEVLDLAHDAIRSLSSSLGAADWIAVLPSGRLAWASAGALCIVTIPADDSSALRVDAIGALPSVLDPVATALPSGHVVLEGHRADGSRLGYVFDPGVASTRALSTSRVPRALLTLPDGTSLELAASGASARRDERLCPFDAPPPSYLFASDGAVLALDAAPRWTVDGGALTPAAGIDEARLDVPALRFAHFEALIDAGGSYAVVLTGEHLEPLDAIHVTDDAITYGTCMIPHAAADGRVRIRRGAANAVVVDTERGARACTGAQPALRVGIGVVARAGARLRSLALHRDLGSR